MSNILKRILSPFSNMSNLSKGVVLTLMSAVGLSFMGLFFKLIGEELSPYEKLFSRAITLFLVGLYLIKRERKRNPKVTYFGKKQNAWLLFVRSFCGMLAMLGNVYAYDHLSLADTDMIFRLNTCFLIIFSFLFLREKLRLAQVGVVVVSLLALVLIIDPRFDNPNLLPYLVTIGSTMLASLAYLVIRYVTTKEDPEHPATIMTHLALFILLSMLYPTIKYYVPFEGHGLVYLYLLGSTIASAVGQFCLTFSFKFAPAKEISVYSYFSLFINAMLGIIIFDNVPSLRSTIGYSMIIGSGVFLWLFNKRVSSIDARIDHINRIRKTQNKKRLKL